MKNFLREMGQPIDKAALREILLDEAQIQKKYRVANTIDAHSDPSLTQPLDNTGMPTASVDIDNSADRSTTKVVGEEDGDRVLLKRVRRESEPSSTPAVAGEGGMYLAEAEEISVDNSVQAKSTTSGAMKRKRGQEKLPMFLIDDE